MRLIDIEPMLAFLEKNHNKKEWEVYQYNAGWIYYWLKSHPTISPDSLVKRGLWDDSGTCRFEDGSIAIRCSECGAALTFDEYTKYHWNYCPNCGAKMED